MNVPPEPLADESSLDARLLFEVSDVTLALPLAAVSRVLAPRPVRRVPHRTGEGILGIVNVDGDLRLCASLAVFCGLPKPARADRATPSRLLVLGSGNRAWVAPVERVVGIAEVLPRAGGQASPEADDANSTVVASVFEHEGRDALLLDPERLLEAFERSLS